MKKTAILSACVASLVFGVCSCTTSKPYQVDVSMRAYEKAMAEFDRLELTRQPYGDWRLFQEQDTLRTLYCDLLGIDPKEAMAEFDKANAEYQQAYDAYRQERGMTNAAASSVDQADLDRDTKLHEQFMRQFKPTHTNHASAIMIVWEMWAEFRTAEAFFRNRMISDGVGPKRAFEALWLSNRHRRGIGQWEQGGAGMWPLHYLGEDIPHPEPDVRRQLDEGESPYEIEGMVFKNSNIAHSRAVAQTVLDEFSPDLKAAPFSSKLAGRAREEIVNSVAAEKKERWGSAFQWASDAVVTARSAKVLYELEMKDVEQDKSSVRAGARR